MKALSFVKKYPPFNLEKKKVQMEQSKKMALPDLENLSLKDLREIYKMYFSYDVGMGKRR